MYTKTYIHKTQIRMTEHAVGQLQRGGGAVPSHRPVASGTHYLHNDNVVHREVAQERHNPQISPYSCSNCDLCRA